MSGRPLDGVVVVTMEQALAIPFATRQLADLGARVIKLERPDDGDFARRYDSTVEGLASAFVWLNRGKESVEVDIKSPEGRRLLEALLGKADVFVHNISPPAAGRLGLDSASLGAAFPSLIRGSVSGYGEDGPLSGAKAYDLLVQGETGIMSLSGTEEHYAKVGISIADIAAGMYAYASILAALRHRDQYGEALTVNVALFDALTEWLGYPLLYTKHSGAPPKRMGTSHATIVPYGAFDTADGEQILLAVQNNAEWLRLCEHVLENPELATDPRFVTPTARLANRAALDALLNERLGSLDRKAIIERLEEASIANARLNSIEDLAGHEQLVERQRWIETGTEAGTVHTLLPPWVPDGHDLKYGDVPTLGEHTGQVKSWLGIED